jgi:hypothetical protein
MTNNEDSARPLSQIKRFASLTYDSFDLNRLASFTIHWLQEQLIPTTFENIVVAAYRMFPEKFALEGYPEYPDAARANRALLQLGPKYRNWARGSVRKGFVLTASGLIEVGRVKDALSSAKPPEQLKPKQRTAPRTLNLSEELLGIERSALYAKWSKGALSEGTTLDLLEMLSAYAYTPSRALRDRLTVLENTAKQLGRKDLLEFLESVQKKFTSELRDERGD